MMGGIVADLHARCTLPGLYAVGESSCTGLHGANRLASNSLSECFVFARRAILHALSESHSPSPAAAPAELEALQALSSPSPATPETRNALWRDAGIVRTAEGLRLLLEDPHPLARMLARSALERTESRGAHQRLDHPERDPALDQRHFVIAGSGNGSWQRWV
jgi:L-aspartate oxidase